MRKTFPLTDDRHAPPQVLAKVKHTVRKYLKRERRKALPEGADYWDFDCKVGPEEALAEVVHVGELIQRIGQVADQGSGAVYVEVLARPERRAGRGPSSA